MVLLTPSARLPSLGGQEVEIFALGMSECLCHLIRGTSNYNFINHLFPPSFELPVQLVHKIPPGSCDFSTPLEVVYSPFDFAQGWFTFFHVLALRHR